MKRSATTAPAPVPEPTRKPWHVYLARCADGSIYTGITDDVDARIIKHNNGRGAKYTAQRRPVKLLYSEMLPDQGSAMRRETQIKKWRRSQKESLAAGSPPPSGENPSAKS